MGKLLDMASLKKQIVDDSEDCRKFDCISQNPYTLSVMIRQHGFILCWWLWLVGPFFIAVGIFHVAIDHHHDTNRITPFFVLDACGYHVLSIDHLH